MQIRHGTWLTYGVCPCGYKQYAPFGDTFHIHLEVCPNCGTSKYAWAIKTMRRNMIKLDKRWFQFWKARYRYEWEEK
jgi:hypothetical protein